MHRIQIELAPDPTTRLAVIDTDSGFVTVLSKRAEAAGWLLRTSGGAVPPDQLVAMKLNALLVDPAVLGDEAWRYLDRVCSLLPDLGVVVCTGRSTVAQRVRGLRLGVDDWITKPAHPEEAIARIEAVSRRRRRARREFELLHLLAAAEGRVLEREAIYQRVWGYAMAHGDRSVDVFVRKLRQKLKKHSPGWRYIHTHFGIGYRFDPEVAAGGTPEAAAGAVKAATGSQAVPSSLTVA